MSSETITRQRAAELAHYVKLTFRSHYDLTEYRGENVVQKWLVSADINLDDPDEGPDDLDEVSDLITGNVGTFRISKLDISSPRRLLQVLDDQDGEVFDVAEQIFDYKRNDIKRKLDDELHSFGSSALVLEAAEVTDQWRGTGMGRLLAATALSALLPGCRFAALVAAPLNKPNEEKLPDAAYKKAKRKLGTAWATLGFKRLRNDVMILDPDLDALPAAIIRMRAEMQLGREY